MRIHTIPSISRDKIKHSNRGVADQVYFLSKTFDVNNPLNLYSEYTSDAQVIRKEKHFYSFPCTFQKCERKTQVFNIIKNVNIVLLHVGILHRAIIITIIIVLSFGSSTWFNENRRTYNYFPKHILLIYSIENEFKIIIYLDTN